MRLAGQLAQLGYPRELDAVTSRLPGIAAYVPLPLRGGEQRLNAEPAVLGVGALLVDDAGLGSAWIETTLIRVPTDPGRSAAMSVRAPAAGATDADVVLAWHVLTAVAERRRFAS